MSNFFPLLFLCIAFILSTCQAHPGYEECERKCVAMDTCSNTAYDGTNGYCTLVFTDGTHDLVHLQTTSSNTIDEPTTESPNSTEQRKDEDFATTKMNECKDTCDSINYCFTYAYIDETSSCEIVLSSKVSSN